MKDVKETSKLLAEYLGWQYVGFNSEEKDLKPGWYKTRKKIGNPNIIQTALLRKYKLVVLDDETLGEYVCRSDNELRFYNSFGWLFEVVLDLMSDEKFKVVVDNAPRVYDYADNLISEIRVDLGIREQLFYALGDAVKYLKDGKKVSL